MVKHDDEIKVLGDINVELESGTKKLREKLSQEEKALEEFNSTLDNTLEKLSQEKDSPDEFYGFMYDTDNDANEPLHETEDFFVGLDESIQVVVVQNNVQQEVVLYLPVHEELLKRSFKWLMIKLKHCLIKKWLMNVWIMNMLKKEDQARRLESPKKRWLRLKSQRKADKDPLVSLVFGS
ncbi:hypothetical protein Tco_0752990 [Tanacetum coccineum]